MKISVVIPLYNKEKSVKRTIDSVLMQEYLPSEIIVVNDGSTDQSLQIVKDIQSPLIRIIDKNNEGVSKARNVGFENAQHSWIALLDGDDVWMPNHLQILRELIIAFPKNMFFTTSFSINELNTLNNKNDKGYLVENYFKTFNEKSFVVNSSTAFINKECFNNNFEFDESLKCGEDIEYWLRLFKKYQLVKSDQVTSIYKMDSENRALSRNIPFANDFASKIVLRGKFGLERSFYKKYLLSKIKTYLYKKEFNNLCQLLLKHRFQLLK